MVWRWNVIVFFVFMKIILEERIIVTEAEEIIIFSFALALVRLDHMIYCGIFDVTS